MDKTWKVHKLKPRTSPASESIKLYASGTVVKTEQYLPTSYGKYKEQHYTYRTINILQNKCTVKNNISSSLKVKLKNCYFLKIRIFSDCFNSLRNSKRFQHDLWLCCFTGICLHSDTKITTKYCTCIEPLLNQLVEVMS